MTEIKEQQCASVGMRVGLLCATLALIVPLVFVIPYAKDMYRYKAADNLMTLGVVAFILVVFYASAAILGKTAGKIIGRSKRGLGAANSVGICLALGCLAVTAVTADFSISLAKRLSGQSERFGLLSGLIILFGALPAILLGVLYGVLVRRRLTKAEGHSAT